MDLAVAGRVEQHPIVRGITAAMRPPDLVMVVPSCESGNRLVADGAEAVLLFPQVQQLPSAFEVVRHLHA